MLKSIDDTCDPAPSALWSCLMYSDAVHLVGIPINWKPLAPAVWMAPCGQPKDTLKIVMITLDCI